MTYPLQLAVGGRAREIAQLLVSHRAGPGDHTRVGFGALPPLSQAVKNGQLPMVALLISMGADVNQRDDLGMTPLLWSSLSDFGSTSVSEALLAAGADPAAVDNHNSTALQLAEKFQFSAMARLLAQHRKTPGR